MVPFSGASKKAVPHFKCTAPLYRLRADCPGDATLPSPASTSATCFGKEAGGEVRAGGCGERFLLRTAPPLPPSATLCALPLIGEQPILRLKHGEEPRTFVGGVRALLSCALELPEEARLVCLKLGEVGAQRGELRNVCGVTSMFMCVHRIIG